MTRLDHVTITTDDLDVTLTFYDAALGALGLTRLDELVDEEEDDAVVEAVSWGASDGGRVLWVVSGTPVTSGLHLRLETDSQHDVETFYSSSVRAGGSAHTAPRTWTLYRRGQFHAIVADPAGNLIEAFSPQ